MSNAKAVLGYEVVKPFALSTSLDMQFDLEVGVAITFRRNPNRRDSFMIDGSESVSPDWEIGSRYIKEFLSPEDFLRFRKEFNV
jgi:hypothetical protein